MAARITTNLVLALTCATLLAACGGSGDGGSSSSPSPANTGSLRLKLTDSPIDYATEVIVVFTGVELKPRNGEPVSYDVYCPAITDDCRDGRKRLDLLKLRDGVTADLLNNRAVPAGEYEWMRLKVLAERNQQDGSYITIGSQGQNRPAPGRYPLFIPSGSETGLKLVRPFTIAAGGITQLVIDFDLRKSVIAPPGLAPNYLLKPTLRLVDELQTGTISGTVDLAALGAVQNVGSRGCDGGVYLFAGHDAKPDDMDGTDADGADPLLYRRLEPAGGATSAGYRFSFVATGAYTVAATCDFGVDVADGNDYDPRPGAEKTMRWTQVNTNVAAGQTVTVNLP